MTTTAEEILRIEPSRELREALSRAVASFGAAVRGIYALEWREDRECICITQKNTRGSSTVCVEIQNPDGSPRQADMSDIEDFKRQLHRRLENQNWVKEHYDRKEEARKKAKQERRELAEYTAKEMMRIAKYGFRTVVDLGARSETPGSAEGFTVIDRRIKHDEVTA